MTQTDNNRETKVAEGVTFVEDAAQAHLAALAKAQSLDKAKTLFLAALGGGALAGGSMGVLEMFGRNRRKAPEDNPRIGAIRVPFRYPTKPTAALPAPKTAGAVAGAASNVAEWMKNFVRGNTATTPEGVAWGLPLGVGALLGGGALGFGATRAIANRQHLGEMDEDVAAARRNFERAMLEQYDTPLAPPVPATQKKIAEALYALYDKLADAAPDLAEVMPYLPVEKTAASPNDLAGQFGGYYGAAAMLAALAAGMQSYGWARKRDPDTVLASALKQRRREEYGRTPPTFVAVPQPTAQIPKPSPIDLTATAN